MLNFIGLLMLIACAYAWYKSIPPESEDTIKARKECGKFEDKG